MMPAPHALQVELVDILANNFDLAELEDLAFRLDITDLPPNQNRKSLARYIVGYLDRRNRIEELGTIGPVVRDDLPWLQILGRYGYVPAEQPAAELSYLDLQKLLPILADYPLFQTPDGRRSVLYTAGISPLVNVDLNGGSRLVANNLLTELNRYGKTEEGDIAIGRLLKYLLLDEALPPAQKEIITAMVGTYNLA